MEAKKKMPKSKKKATDHENCGLASLFPTKLHFESQQKKTTYPKK
jgi:hypothetical protein